MTDKKMKYIEIERFKIGKFIGIVAGLIFLMAYFISVSINIDEINANLCVISFLFAIISFFVLMFVLKLTTRFIDWNKLEFVHHPFFYYKQKIPVQVERRR